MTPEMSHTGSAGTSKVGGPMRATSTHTTAAPRLAIRTRRIPSDWSACWYFRSNSGSVKRNVRGSRRSQPGAKATRQVYGPYQAVRLGLKFGGAHRTVCGHRVARRCHAVVPDGLTETIDFEGQVGPRRRPLDLSRMSLVSEFDAARSFGA